MIPFMILALFLLFKMCTKQIRLLLTTWLSGMQRWKEPSHRECYNGPNNIISLQPELHDDLL